MFEGVNSRFDNKFEVQVYDLKVSAPQNQVPLTIVFGQKAQMFLKEKNFNLEKCLLLDSVKTFWDNSEEKKKVWLLIKTFIENQVLDDSPLSRQIRRSEVKEFLDKGLATVLLDIKSKKEFHIVTSDKILIIKDNPEKENEISFEEFTVGLAALLLFNADSFSVKQVK